ncbi:MAG: cysteine hydrolase family protein [Caldilineaceae bacterium]
MAKQALLIIDVQNCMFNPEAPVHNHDVLLANLRTLIDRARSSATSVIYIQHCGPDGAPHAPGLPGWEIHPAIAPQPGEPIVQKRTPDSFHETTLRAELDSRSIEELVVCGIQTDYCVDTTTRRAASESYGVTLVTDAHSTWGDSGLSAQQIIDHHNQVLGNWFAKLQPTGEISFQD